ncbi:MAG TPA: 5'/3'-nucleotidase SurE, partial [bacterium]|nr:5'/3'-nucleotidase SurE [bacterium]
MPARPRILLTNDDGVYAPGLVALACVLHEVAEVRVVAPDRPRSAAGHAITLHKPLRMEPATLRQYAQYGIPAFGTTGTPADCVILGTYEVYGGELPDLCVSGINSGPNVGDDVTYSGTIAAAMEASLMGVPAIAASMGWFGEYFHYWDAARALRMIVEHWGGHPPTRGTLWNVNLPNVPLPQYRGFQFTRLGQRTFKDVLDKRIDPKGHPYWWIAGEKYEDDRLEGTDTHALRQNYVSITPIDMDMTAHEQLPELRPHSELITDGLPAVQASWESPGPEAGQVPY